MGFTSNRAFCVAPWLHLHVDSAGRRGLCCMAKPADAATSALSHADFLESDYLRSRRRQMMSGQSPAECHLCERPNRELSYRDFLNSEFSHHYYAIEKHTDEEGFVQRKGESADGVPLVFFDLRGKECTLRCKTCGPDASSAWAKSIMENPAAWSGLVAESELDQWKNFRSSDEETSLKILKNSSAERIYFAGGEPLASRLHWSILEELLRSGRAAKVQLTYNTNLQLSLGALENWVEKLHGFRSATVYCSLDGVGATAEYLRTGLRYETFLKCFERGQQLSSPTVRFALDATVTSLFLLEVNEFSELLLRLDCDFEAKLMIGADLRALFLRPEFLPQYVRQQILRNWEARYGDRPALKKLRGVLQLAAEAPEQAPAQVRAAIDQTWLMERNFGQVGVFAGRLTNHPETASWWDSLKLAHLPVDY